MPVSVHLSFVPPDIPNLVEMKIYEGTTPASTFTPIESGIAVGTYPNYIDNYTTALASDVSHYFAIEFLDSKGATTGLSVAVKGDQELAIASLKQRVMERDSSLNERVVLQESESALQYAFPAIDPYDATLQPTYLEMRGLTNLTLAMCYLTEMAHGLSSGWTAGIVSLKTSDVAVKLRADAVGRLVKQANRDLNINFSVILYLQDIEVAGGTAMAGIDQSRLLVELR